MAFTDLTIRLLLVFFPGILCFLVVEALTVHRERKTHEVIFFGYVYGILSYLTYCSILLVLGTRFSKEHWVSCTQPDLVFFRSLTDATVPLDFLEIGLVAVCAFFLAFLLSYFDKRKSLHHYARVIGATNKFGEPNVWSYILNSKEARWCVVRDLTNKLMFQGYLRAFSDVEGPTELILTNVIVYNEQTTEECYRAEMMYFARKTDDLTIEFQSLPMAEGVPDVGPAKETGTQDKGGTSVGLQPCPVDGGNGKEGRTQSPEHQHGPPGQTGRQLPAASAGGKQSATPAPAAHHRKRKRR